MQDVEVGNSELVEQLEELEREESILRRVQESREEAVLQEHAAQVLLCLTVLLLEKLGDSPLEERERGSVVLALEVELGLELLLKLDQLVDLLLVLLLLLGARQRDPCALIVSLVLDLLNLIANLLDLVFVLLLGDHQVLDVHVPEDAVQLGLEDLPDVVFSRVDELQLVPVVILKG